MHISIQDELLDIVDQHDHVIGQEYRSEIYKQKAKNFRVINAFLMNDLGEVWIPRRSASKKLFPLCLDASVGGHVAAGETYDQAFARELQEELALDVNLISYQLLGKLTPEQGVSAYMQLYLIKSNNEPDYNRNDFISASWFSIDAIQELLKAGKPAKGDLLPLICSLRNWLNIR